MIIDTRATCFLDITITILISIFTFFLENIITYIESSGCIYDFLRILVLYLPVFSFLRATVGKRLFSDFGTAIHYPCGRGRWSGRSLFSDRDKCRYQYSLRPSINPVINPSRRDRDLKRGSEKGGETKQSNED